MSWWGKKRFVLTFDYSNQNFFKYKGCFKSNASYFIMLAHSIRGRCWWYGSRGWTFLPIFYYVLLPCDRWQQRGSLTEWCLTWKCVWSKGVSVSSSTWKKLHPLTFTDACWTLMETKQWVWAQRGTGGAFQQRWQWVTLTGIDCFKCSMQAFVHRWWKCIADGGDCVERVFHSWEFALSSSVIILFVSVVVSFSRL